MLPAQKGLPMNRSLRVTSLLSQFLVVLTVLCASAIGRAATVATPTFSPVAGTYTSNQTVTISDTTSGSSIYYTTDGTTPTISSTKYSSAITVNATKTLKAIATKSGYTNSVATAAYTLVAPIPSLSLAAGTYGSSQTETITDSNSSAVIYYTTDGSAPTVSSTRYTAPFVVNSSETVKAIAVVTGYSNSSAASATYTFVVPTPTFSLVGGTYYGSQTVTISDSNSGAKIYYTTDGSAPTTSSTQYTGAITVSATETINAMAKVTNYSPSAVATAAYTITTSSGTLSIFLSQPGAQSTTVAGAATETFDALTPKKSPTPYTTPYTSTLGIYTGGSTAPFAILAHDLYGGATDSSTSSTLTNYLAVGSASGSTSPVYLTFAQPVSYFGFWWSAGDASNRIALYSGTTLYGTFSTADLLTFLKNGSGTITATNGTAYQTSTYFGNPNLAAGSNDAPEPFAYVSFSITGATITKVAFYNTNTSSNFESDNHSAIFNGNTVAIPTTFVPVENMSLGSQTVTVTVSPATATVSASGTQQFAATVTGSTNTAVNWTISPATGAGSINASGVYSAPTSVTTPQTVTITATSAANTAVSASGTVTLKATPTISISNLPSNAVYVGSFTPTFTYTGDGTPSVTSNSTSICTVSSGVVNFVGVGTCSLTPSATIGTRYTAVTGTAQNFSVSKASATVTLTPSSLSQTYTSSPLPVSSTTSPAGLSVTYTYNGSSTVPSAAGSYAVVATISDANYTGTASGTLNIAKASATVTLTPSSLLQTYTGSPLSVTSTTSPAGLSVTYTYNGSSTAPSAAGSYPVVATISDANYTGTASATLVIAKAAATVTLAQSSLAQTYTGSPLSVTSTTSPTGLSVTYTYNGSSIVPSAAGSYPVAATISDPNYTGTSTGLLVIAKANPSLITWPTASNIYYGQTLANSILSGGASTPAGTFAFTTPTTAPSVGTAAQSVTFTPTDSVNYNAVVGSANVTVTKATPTVSIWPTATSITNGQTLTSSTLSGGTATVSGTFAWTTPTTVPAAGTTSQNVIFAPSDSINYSTVTGSVSVTVSAPQCTGSYQRTIVIDHTKVPNTDQINFPFLFNTTDPTLATTANGGHVYSPNGNDIVFSADPNGATKLDYELEKYDPANGQVVAWVRIPTLSHTADTLIYLFYGNSSNMPPQQNPEGVWDSNYLGVWHVANNNGQLSLVDSTSNKNNATSNGATVTTGQIDGGMQTNGSTYATIGTPASLANLAQGKATFSAWVNTATGVSGRIMGKDDDNGSRGWALGVNSNNNVDFVVVENGADFRLGSTTAIGNATWSYVTVTLIGSATQSEQATIYINGVPNSSGSGGTKGTSDDSNQTAYLANATYGDSAYAPLNGSADEFRISNTIRSADWIATEYSNQSSSSTFYSLSSESSDGTPRLTPSAVSLFAGQSQQFATLGVGTCRPVVIGWEIIPAEEAINANGTYTAPASITSLQTVTVTAKNQSSGLVIGSATVTLLPDPSITLVAASKSPYSIGSSQGFVATIKDPLGAPEVGVVVSFSVAGVNNNAGSMITDSKGIASFAYIGANAGNDTVQVTAIINNRQLTSKSVSVSWTSSPPANAEGSVALQAGVNLGLTGLCGAFTDSDGAVIEPIAIGVAPRVYVVPAGATQLQFGVVDDRFWDNVGTGFVVEVNGVLSTVVPTAMPWNWVVGGLNTNYKFGILDGTNPIVALTDLKQGAEVSIAYQSGTISAGSGWPYVGADGDQQAIASVNTGSTGTYFPTLYMTSSNYPIGQPIPISAVVTNGSGAPLANVPVTLHIAGANNKDLNATTDSLGKATFTYVGGITGTDILVARAFLSGKASLVSGQTSVTWTGFTSLAPSGSLTLSPNTVQPLPAGGQQAFTVYATDAGGKAATNVKLELAISGVDNFDLFATTDATGHASFSYQDINPGVASAIVTGFIDNILVYSNKVSVSWSLPGSATGGSGSLSIGITANSIVTLPNTLQLNWTATDSALPARSFPSVTWSQDPGPGTVTFVTSQQGVTTASFSKAGTYVLNLNASDTFNSGSLRWSVTVNPDPGTQQGWIGSPAYGSTVTGVVPIALAPGVSIQNGSLTYSPANNPSSIIVLNGNVMGSGQIGTLDTTTLPNGTYWIKLQGTDSTGTFEYSLVAVTVAGNYKPGRVTATVTDLVVPATGLAINIQRTYDSLNAGTIGDFGYGWNLGINVNLAVDPQGNVTFTLGGQRKTFHLTPQQPSLGLFGSFPWYWPAYTPEQGLHGTLTDSSSNCALDMLVPDGSMWDCISGGQFSPTSYIYTDPNGTAYTIGASGALQSIQDRSGNGLTVTPNGITSTTGVSVPFVRDTSNRITQITDPQGNIYQYGYDGSGNLATVTYPSTPQSTTCSGTTAPNTSVYTYDGNHRYTGGTDGRCNPLPTSNYYPDGRLQSVTLSPGNGAAPITTSYAYDLTTNTTTVTNTDNSHQTLVYDNYGMLLSSTDPLQHTTTNVYDASHNLISVTDPLNHTTTYTYDANGNKTSTTYPSTGTGHNTTSTTVYNQYSEPISTTDELGNVRTFNYDANYLPTSVTDSLGTLSSFLFNPDSTLAAGAIGFDITAQPAKASQFAYDTSGNMISRTDALGRTTSYTYDWLGHKLSTVTPTPTSGTGTADSTTNYLYDSMGNLVQTSAPLGRTTNSTYDSNGNKTSDTDARNNTTSYLYDNLNRLIETDYPDRTKTTKSYDFRNNVIDETDQAGNVTHHEYDAAGRLTTITRGYGSSTPSATTYTYYDNGLKESETDHLQHTTNYVYDAAGCLTSISGVQGTVTYGYDDAGNKTSSTDGRSNTTTFKYDARKRLIETDYPATAEYPDGTKVKNTYDGPGNLASVIDQANNEVDYTYDAANQLKTVVQKNHPDSSHNTNAYSYDGLGNLMRLADENGHTTVNGFDVFNELRSKTLPDNTHTETRTYDAAGNLTQLIHFDQTTTTYTYDALNRLLSRSSNSPNAEPAVSFTYTETGKRATMSDGSGNTTYTYDALDRLTTKAAPAGTLTYGYDEAGKLASISSNHAHGIHVDYSYDDLNRLSTVTDSRLQGNQTTTYTYDNASNVATVTYPNGLTSTFTYDSLNRVTGLSSQVSSYSYQRDATGKLTNASEDTGRTLVWNYDGINRLTNESISLAPSGHNGNVSYSLDPVGNRLSDTSSLEGITPGSWSFNADDEVSGESYDANGNVTAASGKTFAYDSENHLISMNGGAVQMLYDGDGNRVAKTVSGVTTYYLVDDLNPTGYAQVVEELAANGTVQRQYTYGLQRISQQQMISNVWTPSFYGYDGGGNVRQLTNSAGAVTDSWEYDAYGGFFQTQGSTPNNYLYRGEQYDADLGLYYLRARYYNPNTGRFMSRDPEDGYAKDPASLHKYLYAGGDPINAKDPTGRAILFGTGAIDRSFLLETVPAVVGFVGGTTIAIANFMDAIATGIAEIALDLSEAALDYAMGMFDTAFGLFEEAIDTYDILLHQTGFWGGVTRFLTCDILGTEFAVIAEHVFNAPKAAVLIEKGTQMVCAGLADMKVVHP